MQLCKNLIWSPNHDSYFLLIGKPLVGVGSPDAARTVFQAEGKYPVRDRGFQNIGWILRKNNYQSSIAFT